MFAMKFSGYSPYRDLTLTNARIQVERGPYGYLVVYDGRCSGLCEDLREAIETAATEVHGCQVNVTATHRGS
jgi:hypothetical protein